VFAEEVGGPGGGIGAHGDAEEGLHFAGGGKGDEHAAGMGIAAGKGVGNAARTDDGFTRPERLAYAAYLKGNLAFEDVEVLFLVEVVVERRTAVNEVLVLDDEEAAVGFSGQGLEEHGAEAARVMFAEPVDSRTHDVNLPGRLKGSLGKSEVGKACGGQDCGRGF